MATNLEDIGQTRLNIQQSNICSNSGQLTFLNKQQTNVSQAGDVETIETDNSKIIDGEKISHASQIIGQCQESDCGQYLTNRTFRYCSNVNCGKILCHNHARFHNKEENYFCKECYKSVRRKRFWIGLIRIILTPFVERVNND